MRFLRSEESQISLITFEPRRIFRVWDLTSYCGMCNVPVIDACGLALNICSVWLSTHVGWHLGRHKSKATS
jgi:hypothetical protein